MTLCDSCGAPADDRHVRERVERLELATRLRPVHIQVLLLDAAPPPRPEDYFYRAAKDRSVRSEGARNDFDELIACSGTNAAGEIGEEVALEGFQRRGLFLAYAVECPVQDNAALAHAVGRVVPTLLKRLQISYRPKYVAVLSESLQGLIPVLQDAGWADRLILDEGRPFASPFRGLAAGLKKALQPVQHP
ncbi:MAG: hypothetical protein ABSF78_02935 [Candidatus Acidiferrales bacterium]